MNRMRGEPLDIPSCREFALRALSHGLTSEEAAAMRGDLEKINVGEPGRELIAEGSLLKAPYMLLDGWAMQQRSLRDGRRQIFGFLLPGDLFGLCAHSHMTALCSTAAVTRIAYSSLPTLQRAVRRDERNSLSDLVWNGMDREEIGLRDQVVRLGRQSAQERLAHLLLEFHARLRRVGLAGPNSFHMPLSQEVLSDALGLSIVHTNRTLQQLRHDGLIESRGMLVTLNDLSALAALANFYVAGVPGRPTLPGAVGDNTEGANHA